MSPKNTLLIVGLTALGLLGDSASHAASPGDEPAPTGQPSAPASSSSPTVLLLSNGRILEGAITEEGDKYLVRQRGGVIPKSKSIVEGAFPSMNALYKYKCSQVDDRDPDEHLKLARWCMSQNMPAEARVELEAVAKLSPNAPEITAMLASVEQAQARESARPRLDPSLMQTKAEITERTVPADDSRPAEIDVTVLNKARKALGVSSLPVVFELPPALAVKRADEFARYVNPLLMASCVKCHNERRQLTFQLIEVKNRHALTGDILRANLDATLQLINKDDPSRSDLLSVVLVPHGNGPNKRPIFTGSNDPRFKVLAKWVNSLTPKLAPPSDGIVQTRLGATPKSDPTSSAFASERVPGANPVVLGPNPVPLSTSREKRVIHESVPNARYLPGGPGTVLEQSPPSPDEFPVPFSQGGARPTPYSGLPPLPNDKSATSKKPKKPIPIDPALLEKALMNRNGGR